MRGSLSKKVQNKAKELIGRELSRDELRLIPYMQYVMVNDQKIDICKLNGKDEKIMREWNEANYYYAIQYGSEESYRLVITKELWNFMCEILFIAYVERAD